MSGSHESQRGSLALPIKTVTVALSAEQYAWMQEAVANQRRVWDILLEMQRITAEYMVENLPHPPRRKRLTKKRLGLN